MNLIDYIVLASLSAVIISIIIWIVRRKKQGGCACCSQRDSCTKSKFI